MSFEYDKTIKVGDVVTGYDKGYFIVTGIVPRKDNNPIVEYIKIANESYNFIKSNKVLSCDIYYCKRVEAQVILDKIKALENAAKEFIAKFIKEL